MKKLTTTLLASSITLMSVTPTFAEWSENILANPGAQTLFLIIPAEMTLRGA